MSERRKKEFRRARDAMFGKLRAEAASGRAAFLQGRVERGVHDEMLLHREIYNPNSFAVDFVRSKDMDQYVRSSLIPLGPEFARCEPGGWLYLPHAYYVASGVGLPLGTPVSIIQNFGDEMFKGNKKVSLPALS